MLITTIAALLVGQTSPLLCPVMGSAVHGKGSGSYDYNGARYTMCCAGCNGAFEKDPAKFVKQSTEAKKVVGINLFDPTTGLKIDTKQAKASADFGHLRYYFATEEGKKKFEDNPKQFTVQPKKEALWCAVMNHSLKSYAEAGAYVDQGDTRYYVCCPGCLSKLKADPSNLTAKIRDKVSVPKASAVKS